MKQFPSHPGRVLCLVDFFFFLCFLFSWYFHQTKALPESFISALASLSQSVPNAMLKEETRETSKKPKCGRGGKEGQPEQVSHVPSPASGQGETNTKRASQFSPQDQPPLPPRPPCNKRPKVCHAKFFMRVYVARRRAPECGLSVALSSRVEPLA